MRPWRLALKMTRRWVWGFLGLVECDETWGDMTKPECLEMFLKFYVTQTKTLILYGERLNKY